MTAAVASPSTADAPPQTAAGGLAVERFHYDDQISKNFAWATVIWAVIGMTAGLYAALELVSHKFNFDLAWLSFGRLRPVHTTGVVFAFVGNSIFAGVYYSTQRLLKARMFSDALSKFNFWGWQIAMAAGVITLPMGFTQSKEYAELEWPIDILIALVVVAFLVNFIGTMLRRRERHLYVALWFYLASFLALAILFLVNNAVVPVAAWKGYSVFAGVQDALVQWWYGHNAVAFLLTTPFLGMMYYFVPKAAVRPVYSYRLSIIHFWSLIFIYMWAGPHHLLYTALPEWAQTLGTVFSVALLAPSWGGMFNGLFTLRGAWDKLRKDPILKFFVAALTFYGMATFEGPMLALKSVNALSHYTNWTIGHVHAGALGWNGFLTFGMLYWMIPRLYNRKLYSVKLASAHFWLGLTGIGLYVISMWISGVAEGLMWQELNEHGELTYGAWTDMLPHLFPMYVVRALGGTLYLTGVFLMVYNFVKTTAGAKVEDTAAEAPPMRPLREGLAWHSKLEAMPLTFTLLTTIAVAAGGFFEIVPSLMIKNNVPTIASVKPYTALELEGRDIYVAEGCSVCHSQMIRPFRAEVMRYQGLYSKPGEFIFDRPFQFGSRRIGPDLHRIGLKYAGEGGMAWHYNHMLDPRETSKGSLMPSYPWLFEEPIDFSSTVTKMRVYRDVFEAPYTQDEVDNAVAHAQAQAARIGDALVAQGLEDVRDRKIVALIAYLLRLGTDITKDPNMPASDLVPPEAGTASL